VDIKAPLLYDSLVLHIGIIFGFAEPGGVLGKPGDSVQDTAPYRFEYLQPETHDFP
jgi:hypothetical protein